MDCPSFVYGNTPALISPPTSQSQASKLGHLSRSTDTEARCQIQRRTYFQKLRWYFYPLEPTYLWITNHGWMASAYITVLEHRILFNCFYVVYFYVCHLLCSSIPHYNIVRFICCLHKLLLYTVYNW